MSVDARLAYEARVRPRQAVVAGAAAVLLIVSAVLQLAGPHTRVSEVTLGLIFEHRRFVLDLVGAALEAFGWLALAWTLWFLFGCARARERQIQTFIGPLALIGAALAAIGILGYVIAYGSVAQQFVTQGAQTYPEAHRLMGEPALGIFQIMDYLGELLLAVGFLLISLQSMRVGLLTRFMGFLGIIGGVLTLFVITPVPIVQFYWLAALAYLFSGRWPNGVPPAWRTGRVERWPSSQELRQQQARARAQRGKAPALTRDAVPAAAGAGRSPQGEAEPAQAGGRPSGARSNAKRKRKRRR